VNTEICGSQAQLRHVNEQRKNSYPLRSTRPHQDTMTLDKIHVNTLTEEEVCYIGAVYAVEVWLIVNLGLSHHAA
jgi:hypothetical protein